MSSRCNAARNSNPFFYFAGRDAKMTHISYQGRHDEVCR